MYMFYLRDYIVDPEKHFIRESKMNFVDHIKFIFWNKGRNNDIEIAEYFKLFKEKKFETISHQAIGKQRIYIKPKLFENLYKHFINLIYRDHPNFSKIKGYIVCACDSSIFDLPNVTLTRFEFNIEENTIFETHRVRARVSGMLDVNSKFMLVTKIVEKTVKETTLAMDHLNELKKRFDIKKFIAVYDRGYKSIELMLFTEKLESKFLIRLPKNTFAKKRRQIKGNDKIIEINLTNAILKEFENKDLVKFANEIGRYKLRIVEIKLDNGSTEVLATNLSIEEFTFEELKELYAKRWSIETGFKKLKSQIQIEEFSGHRRVIIEQDFYAKILIYNLATAIQWDAEHQMKIKQRKTWEEYIYKSNFATITGLIFNYMEYLLSGIGKYINDAVEFLIKQGRRLYHQKNIRKLRLNHLIKILNDIILQLKWGDEWESKKPIRSASDPSNDHPGTPKRSH